MLDCSSSTHTWDAFQLARASFRLYCVRNSQVLPANSHKVNDELGPCLLGDRLKINVDPPELDAEEDDESSLGTLPAIRIHDDDVSLRFLVCGVPSSLVSWNLSLFTGLYLMVPLLGTYAPNFMLKQTQPSTHIYILSVVCLWTDFFSGCVLVRIIGRWPQCPLEHWSKFNEDCLQLFFN